MSLNGTLMPVMCLAFAEDDLFVLYKSRPSMWRELFLPGMIKSYIMVTQIEGDRYGRP